MTYYILFVNDKPYLQLLDLNEAVYELITVQLQAPNYNYDIREFEILSS